MKPNELRIGNIIMGTYTDYDDNNELYDVCKVVTLDSVGAAEYPIWVEGKANVEQYDCFDPIPLNEEWLLKFGFIKIEKHHVFYISTINPMFKFCPDIHSAAWDNQMLRRVKIQYVHQLQNFFFALTGEELTVLQA
jgi:hypothetical protein